MAHTIASIVYGLAWVVALACCWFRYPELVLSPIAGIASTAIWFSLGTRLNRESGDARADDAGLMEMYGPALAAVFLIAIDLFSPQLFFITAVVSLLISLGVALRINAYSKVARGLWWALAAWGLGLFATTWVFGYVAVHA